MKFLRLLYSRYLSGNLAKGGIAIFVGTMGANVAAYLYHLIVGRILGPIQYGELASLLSLSYILNVPVALVQTVLTKYFSILKARKSDRQAKQLFLVSTKYLSVAILLGLFLMVIVTPMIVNFLHITDSVNILWIYAAFGIGFISVVPASIMLGYQLFGSFAFFSSLGAFLRLIFGALLAPFGVSTTLLGAVIYITFLYIAMLWPIRFVLEKKSSPLSLRKRDVLSYSVPAFLALLGVTMLNQQDVILIKHFFSPHEAGIYSAISILGKIIFFASSSIGLVIFPILSERVERKESYQGLVVAAISFVSVMSFVLTGMYFLFPIPITTLLYGPGYVDAAQYLGVFALFMSFFSLDNLLMSICLAVGKTGMWVLPLSGALIQIVLLNLYHSTLFTASLVNLGVAAGLFVFLSVYYIRSMHV